MYFPQKTWTTVGKIGFSAFNYIYTMNKEIQNIIRNIEDTNSGSPWFGRSVYELLEETDPKKVFIRPNNSEHTLADILFHMLTWAEFTLNRLEGNKKADLTASEKLDWREINPKIHTWKKGIKDFKAVHKTIIAILKTKDDSFLKGKVDYRTYDFSYLLNGFVQHNIYHAGQIAYLNKLL